MSVRTSSLDEAHDIGAALYYPQQLVAFDRSALDFTLEGVRLGPLMIGRLSYRTEIRIDSAELGTGYQINLALSGAVESLCGRQEAVIASNDAAVFNPCGRTLLRRWSADATVLGLKIDRAFLERQVTALTGATVTDPVTFRMGVDLEDPRHGTWLRLFHVVAGLLDDTVTEGTLDVLAERLPETLVSTFLLAVPSNYSEVLHAPRGRWEPAAVKCTVEAINDRPGYPWTAEALAEVAGISVRSLQTAFHRVYDRAPFAYLREVRLDGVHAELQKGQGPVSQIAADYGFTNLGRFAGYYKERFGVHPRTTLREARFSA
jgi:AraC-like DNA-binding protein